MTGPAGPLDGVRVLAVEQMQALPFGTQLLGRLGADVVKVEPIVGGDLGRSSLPAMTDPQGRAVGATFLRNNLGKRSIAVDLKRPEGRRLLLQLAPRFDVLAENLRAGALARLGLGYHDVAEAHPSVVYLSISGFGNPQGSGTGRSPYESWPAYAALVEAMSGIYELKRRGDEPPVVSPAGALGDIGTALFGVVGVLAALRHRDRTGEGQHVDVAMLDSLVALTDIVTNFWSMGQGGGRASPMVLHGFRASDGWFILQVLREHQFESLARLLGHPAWLTDARLATRQGWLDCLESDIRPAVETWAATRTRMEACHALAAAGLPAGPCLRDEEVVHDEHLAVRGMLVALDRTDGVDQPVLVPGNPVKLSRAPDRTGDRVPWHAEHTEQVLTEELGLDAATVGRLRRDGVVA